MWASLSPIWQACIEQAWDARRAGTIPIGAAVVAPDGRILSTGRNRIWQPRELSAQHISGTRLAHAEVNALYAVDHAVDLHGCTLYTTTEPCPMCAGAIVMCNIRHVAYASRDPWAGAVEQFSCGRYMLSKNMTVDGPFDPHFERLLVGLQIEYFYHEGANRPAGALVPHDHPIFAAYEAYSPAGFRLGERLYHEGRIEHLISNGAGVGEMLEVINK